MLSALATFALVILVVGCLYWAKPVLVPTALAILLTFLLSPVATWLQRRGLPRVLAVAMTVSLAALVIAAIGWLFMSQVLHLADQLPSYKGNVTRRIAELRQHSEGSPFEKVGDFLEDVEAALTAPAPGDGESEPRPIPVTTLTDAFDPSAYFVSAAPLLAPVGSAGLMLVLVIFMLARREDLRNRVLRLIGQGRMVATTKALDEAGQRLSRYLLAQFCLNVGFGVVVATGLSIIGLPHALLWGILAGLLRYIPILGPWLAAILPVSLSLLISESWLQPLTIVAIFAVFEFTSNLIVEPLVYGQSIGVSPAVLMLAIAFWTWLWGPLGMVLAAPLTVCLAVLGKYVPQFRFFDVLLGDTPVLSPEAHFYQRLVARDLDEALEIARNQSQTLAWERLCDQLFIPALVSAKRDFDSGELTHDDVRFIVRAIREMADELSDVPLTSLTAGEGDEDRTSGKLTILACAAADDADRVALELFARAANSPAQHVEIVSAELLAAEIVSAIHERRPAIVLIAALPPTGLARTKLLCKRLRSKETRAKIAIGRWGESLNGHTASTKNRGGEANHQELIALGADYVGTSLEQSLAQLTEVSQFLRPAERAIAPR
jgi:predicted PurR-regulated permease PerM